MQHTSEPAQKFVNGPSQASVALQSNSQSKGGRAGSAPAPWWGCRCGTSTPATGGGTRCAAAARPPLVAAASWPAGIAPVPVGEVLDTVPTGRPSAAAAPATRWPRLPSALKTRGRLLLVSPAQTAGFGHDPQVATDCPECRGAILPMPSCRQHLADIITSASTNIDACGGVCLSATYRLEPGLVSAIRTKP